MTGSPVIVTYRTILLTDKMFDFIIGKYLFIHNPIYNDPSINYDVIYIEIIFKFVLNGNKIEVKYHNASAFNLGKSLFKITLYILL